VANISEGKVRFVAEFHHHSRDEEKEVDQQSTEQFVDKQCETYIWILNESQDDD